MKRASRACAIAALLLLVAAPRSAPADPNPLSEWRPGCYIPGEPIELDFWFCNTGAVNGQFEGAPNNSFFFIPGAYLALAIYDTSERGFIVWGPHSDDPYEFEEIGPSEVRGSGVPEDPFEHRGVYGAGNPRQLLVRQYTEYTNGRAAFTTRYEVTNVSNTTVNFRASVFADTHIHGMCAYGDLQSSPRALGSFTPEEGAPYEPNDCYFTERDRGFSMYAVEQPGSPWSAYQQGDEMAVEQAVDDAAGPGLNNTFDPRPIPEAMAVQWDDYGRGTSGLAPGETATFDLGWRASSDMVVTPFHGASRDNVHRVKVSTRFARNGPIPGQQLAYQIDRDLGNNGTTRGTVTTNDRGIAFIEWRAQNIGYDRLTVSFDDNGDGRIQEANELFRFGMNVRWEYATDSYPTRLTFERTPAGFAGRVYAIHETDPDFGADCREYRAISIRRKEPGRDTTFATAAANQKGVWDLDVGAPPTGDYYGVVLRSSRALGNGLPYVCRSDRAS